jgi:FixJ family two-component response regulator
MRDRTVFLVDDDAAVRDSLALLLEQHGLRVEGFAGAQAFLAACGPQARGCAIIDLRMPGRDGLWLQQEMIERCLPVPVIILTGHGDIPATVRAVKAGAVDFLTKPVKGDTLLAAIRAAFDRADALERELDEFRAAASALDQLTVREKEVVELAAQGKSNKEIARGLGISHRTVEIHKAHVMHKTGARTLLELSHLFEASTRRP